MPQGDRRLTEYDYKRIYLDLANFELIAPMEGIYDEPTVYYKANLKWAKIIEGFLSWLTEITAWKDAEDENFHGIQAITEFLERVDVPFVFPESEDGCNNFYPSAAFVTYYPQNPYNNPDLVPPDYLVPPFFVNSALEYPELMGYQATDVFINPSSITIDPIDLLTLNLPRIEITVKGSGQLEIDFLSVQAGSSAILKIGSMPNIVDIITGGIVEEGVRIIDLNNDSISIPPESDIVVAEEVNIEAEPDELTTVFIVFVPVVNDSFIPLALGGGIRQIGLCAFEGMGENTGVEAVRFNVETCVFEQRINGEWEMIEGGDEWLECVPDGGGGVATKDDIRDGMYEALNRLAAQIVSGRYTNIQIDDEGGVSDPTEGGVSEETPEDDPTTPLDESLAALCGAAIGVRLGLDAICADMQAWYGVDATADIPEATAQFRFKTKYDVDDAQASLFVTEWWTVRAASGTVFTTFSSALDAKLFCKGVTKQTILTYIISSFANNIQFLATLLVNSLNQSQIDSWFEHGQNAPSTAYVAYSCTKIATETFTLNMALAESFTIPFAGVFKGGHRYLVEASGSFTDADFPNKVQDFFWKVDTSSGVKTFIGFTLSISGTVNAIAANVPYQSSHNYAWVFEKTGDNGGSFTKNNDEFNITGAAVVGTLTVSFIDLGEFTI